MRERFLGLRSPRELAQLLGVPYRSLAYILYRLPPGRRYRTFEVRKRAWVKISQVRTLSTRRLGRKLGRVDPEELDRLVEGLNEIIAA